MTQYLPNSSSTFPEIKCGDTGSKGSRADLADFNIMKQVFIKASSVHKDYTGRVKTNGLKITLEPVRFIDEKVTFNCILLYYQNDGNKAPAVTSENATIQNVYGMSGFKEVFPSSHYQWHQCKLTMENAYSIFSHIYRKSSMKPPSLLSPLPNKPLPSDQNFEYAPLH